MSNKQVGNNVINDPKHNDKVLEGVIKAGEAGASFDSAAHNDRLNRFRSGKNGNAGHGFAAEQTNDLIDKVRGNDSIIKGDDNARHGPDRIVDGRLVQTKYYQSALKSVNAAFESKANGMFKYYEDGDISKPMQIEVPKDQYLEALKIMRKRIAEGRVPGVTNPDDAEKLVRQGNITYKTACNIAKAGNIDSLMFDATHGIVIASSAFGISFIITFAKCVWDGKPINRSIDLAMYNGLKAGGIAFVSSVLSAQLTRTNLVKILKSPSEGLVRLLPSKVSRVLVDTCRSGAKNYGKAATDDLAKLMCSNIISSASVVLVLSASDITNCLRGRISARQLFKNVVSTIAGICGGNVGWIAGITIGGVIGGPAGSTIGLYVSGAVGGSAGATVAVKVEKAFMDKFVEDDAVEMISIINERFIPLAQSYLLSEEELIIVIEDLKTDLEQEKLIQMFVSKDRNKFADDMITDKIEKVVCWRSRIVLPPDEEFIKALGRVLELCENKTALESFLASMNNDNELKSKDVVEQETNKKAIYVRNQMNLALVQQELYFEAMKTQEQNHAEKLKRTAKELSEYKKELHNLLTSV